MGNSKSCALILLIAAAVAAVVYVLGKLGADALAKPLEEAGISHARLAFAVPLVAAAVLAFVIVLLSIFLFQHR